MNRKAELTAPLVQFFDINSIRFREEKKTHSKTLVVSDFLLVLVKFLS